MFRHLRPPARLPCLARHACMHARMQVDPDLRYLPNQLIRAEVQWPRSATAMAEPGGAPLTLAGKHILYHPGEVRGGGAGRDGTGSVHCVLVHRVNVGCLRLHATAACHAFAAPVSSSVSNLVWAHIGLMQDGMYRMRGIPTAPAGFFKPAWDMP